MYNHYIPQADGSYRRNHIPENTRRPQPRPAPAAAAPNTPPHSREPEPEPTPQQPHSNPPEKSTPQSHAAQSESPLSFLRKLLPKDLDSTDLIIIALLLLLSGEEDDGDCPSLLTIALYFLL